MDKLRNQLVARLRDAAEGALDAWDEYEQGKLARLIVQNRLNELCDVLSDIERDEAVNGGPWPTGFEQHESGARQMVKADPDRC